MNKPLFAGLVYLDSGVQLETALVGEEPCYVIDDRGFRRHIRARTVDEAALREVWNLLRGHEREVAEQAAKLAGQDDLFTRAVLQQNLEHPETHLEEILRQEMPEGTRLWMGMMGFRVIVNYHGELLRVDVPAKAADGE